MSEKIKLHEFWRHQYRRQRYLENLTNSELKARWEILVDNSLCLSLVDGRPKIGLLPGDSQPRWHELSIHLLEELALRGLPFPGPLSYPDHRGFLDKVQFDNPAKLFSEPEILQGTFKYGRFEHLKALAEIGEIRLCPATHYGKSNYGYSIDDNEMEKFILLNQHNSRVSNLLNGFGANRFVRYNIRIPIKAATDYYLFSISNSFRYRHLYDYGYTAVAKITNRSEFIRRFRLAARGLLGKNFDVIESNVTYVDPLLPGNRRSFIATTMKDIRFAYETEFRLCLVPKTKVDDLGDPISIRLGSLEDILQVCPFN